MASNSRYSVSWDSYQTNVCSGFSTFQQNGDFVDMTLAADNSIVKVHKALIALASPYLKEIIQSTPANQHPVIFLNNVDYDTLCQLLEYIYTGEVMLPMDQLTTFLETGRTLNIRGLENVMDTKPITDTPTSVQKVDITKGLKPVVVKSRQGTGQITIPASAKKVYSVQVQTATPNISTLTSVENEDEITYEMDTFDAEAVEIHDDNNTECPQPQLKPVRKVRPELDASMQFTVSTRGSLQMILNRYLYNSQWRSQTKNTRRWRCVDYRDSRCPAFVITRGRAVIKRYHPHNHAFHDKKIIAKVENNAVYAAIEDIEATSYSMEATVKDTST